MAIENKRYRIAVCVKLGGMHPYRVDVDTDDETGAMLLARLLKEHDDDVMLTEVSEVTEYTRLPVKKWPARKRCSTVLEKDRR